MMRSRPLALFVASVVLYSPPIIAKASALCATPAPTSTPGPVLTYSGRVRSYYYTRTNEVQNSANINRVAYNSSATLHIAIQPRASAFSLGATYFAAEPVGANGNDPASNNNIDNSLPGFAMSTLNELYGQYRSPRITMSLGNQVISTPWANAADARLKPNGFQGLNATVNPLCGVSLLAMRMLRYESRTSAVFERTTLLTSQQPGNPAYPRHDTSGFLLLGITYKHPQVFDKEPRLSTGIYYYDFYDIASLLYIDGKYFPSPMSPTKLSVAFQYVSENQAGHAVIGIINNRTFGLQIAARAGKNLDFSMGYDVSPWRAVSASTSCSSVSGYFLPVGGTPTCKQYADFSRVLYGGVASPYTEAYTADPLFTTSITQGFVERHSAGAAWKAAVSFRTNDKRLQGVLSHAVYDYTNENGQNVTSENDIDVTYFFSRAVQDPYRGWSIRHRYAERIQPTVPFDFKYNRTQLQYDF